MNKFSLFLLLLLPAFLHAVEVPSCGEEERSLLKEFLPTDFDKNRSTVGQDQAEVVRMRVQSFIASNPDMKITKVEVNSLSPRVPFMVLQGTRKIIDPTSDERNSNLARDRGNFARDLLLELRTSSPTLSATTFTIQSSLSGPTFTPTDLNDRFVTPLTPNYRARVESFYREHESLYQELALRQDVSDLLNESEFPNLYQVKFKPFQGFRVEISGINKCKNVPRTQAPAVIRR